MSTYPEGKLNITVGELQDILLYHVVAGAYPSTSLTSGDIKALNGDTISVAVTDAKINVNDACVIVPDIQLHNGIIHVIDMVLIPPGEDEDDTNLNVDVDEPAAATTATPSYSPIKSSPTSADGTIAEFVMNSSDFSLLASLIETAGLTDDLEESGPFTVFGMYYRCNYCTL